jgi:hypothetical protein
MKSTMTLLALAPMLSWGALCDDTYNLQNATQTLFTGTNPKSLAKSTKTLKGDLSDLTVLHELMAYTILTGFEGSCAKAVKPVRFLQRDIKATSFTPRTETGYQVVLYDSNTTLAGSDFDYWFGFYKPADTLKIALGRAKGGSGDFRGWYGFVTFEDSVRNPESGLWTAMGTQLRMAGPSDSAVLDSLLMVRTGFRDLVFDQNRRGHFNLQFIRVSLENKPGIAIRRRVTANAGAGRNEAGEAGNHLVNGKRIKVENAQAFFGNRRYFRNK